MLYVHCVYSSSARGAVRLSVPAFDHEDFTGEEAFVILSAITGMLYDSISRAPLILASPDIVRKMVRKVVQSDPAELVRFAGSGEARVLRHGRRAVEDRYPHRLFAGGVVTNPGTPTAELAAFWIGPEGAPAALSRMEWWEFFGDRYPRRFPL